MNWLRALLTRLVSAMHSLTCDHEFGDTVVLAHDPGNPIDIPVASWTVYAGTCKRCGAEKSWSTPAGGDQ